MLYLREQTEWSSDGVPNHTYYSSNDRRKIVGYIPAGKARLVMFKRPVSFDTRGRKFAVVGRDNKDAQYFEPQKETPQPTAAITRTVAGSRGATYTLSKSAGRWICNCPGYGFRGKCKHSDSMKD